MTSWRFLVVAFVAGAGFLATPAQARADDACVVTPGIYGLTWGRDAASSRNVTGLKQVVKSTIYGDLTLDVACDGTVKIQSPDSIGVWSYTGIASPSGASGQTTSLSENIKMHFAVIGKAKKGINNFPDIQLQVNSDGVSCPAADNALCPHGASEQWTLSGSIIETDAKFPEVSGHNAFNAMSAAQAGNMDRSTVYIIAHSTVPYPPQADRVGYFHGAADGYTMYFAVGAPDIKVSTDLQDVFLANEPSVTIEARTKVYSWGSAAAKGKDVSFTFEGKTIDVAADKMGADNFAVVNFEVGNLTAGTHDVLVTATNLAGQTAKSSYPIVIIPTPPWARTLKNFGPKGIDPTCVTECEYYQGAKSYPDQPLSFGVDIPDIVPFIGGPWGLRNTQFSIIPRPQSRIGPSKGTVTGSGFFGLGGTSWTLETGSGSEVTTTTTPTQLQFTSGNMQFNDQDVSFTKHLGLLSLFASIGDLIPGGTVGTWLRQNDAAGIDATIAAGVHKSMLEFGAKPNDPQITVSKFTTQLDVNVSMQAGINLLFAGGWATGSVDGTLDMTLAPVKKIDNCHLTYKVGLIYSFVGAQGTYPDPIESHEITSCHDDATAYVAPLQRLTDALAAANRGSLFPAAQAATPPPSQALTLAVAARNSTITNRLAARALPAPPGRVQTVLVDGAAGVVAAPAVAAGPNGKRAIVWIGEDTSAPRPQAWQAQVRVYDGARWAPAAPFAGDGKRPDFTPSIAYDGNGTLVIAYSVDTTAALTQRTPLETRLPNMQIEVVTCNGSTGAVISRRIVSAGSGPHLHPKAVTATDGSVWVAWQTVASTDVMAAIAPVRISAVHWNRSTLSAPEVLADKLAGVDSWQIAARDGTTAMLGIDITDANQKRSVHTLERSAGGWKETFAKSAARETNPSVATGYLPDGAAQVLWTDGGAVMAAAHGSAKSFVPAASGEPAAFVADATATSVLMRMPGGGYTAVHIDAKSGKADAASALSGSLLTLAVAGFAHEPAGWVTTAARIPAFSTKASPFDGGSLELSSPAAPKSAPQKK